MVLVTCVFDCVYLLVGYWHDALMLFFVGCGVVVFLFLVVVACLLVWWLLDCWPVDVFCCFVCLGRVGVVYLTVGWIIIMIIIG